MFLVESKGRERPVLQFEGGRQEKFPLTWPFDSIQVFS